MSENRIKVRTSKVEELQVAARELELKREFVAAVALESQKQKLSQASRITDPDVLARLAEAQFDVETLSALDLVPIAFVAWASGSVTDAERKLVMSSLEDYGLLMNHPSYQLFNHWLQTRPHPMLLLLWKDYATAKLGAVGTAERQALGSRLLRKATEVAMASGGILGFGKICDTEQAILDKISDVYGLIDASY